MGEGFNPATGYAWGCTPKVGWVPYPKEIPRRHPLLDAVGRIDDPCARPLYAPPNYEPTPKYKPPREGYPNNMCRLEDYASERQEEQSGGAYANINVGPGTPGGITLHVQPCFQSPTVMAEPPTIEDCCGDARSLDTLKTEVDKKVLGPHECLEAGMKKWAKCMSPCAPRLQPYPCRGVIKAPRPDWLKYTKEQMCKPSLPNPDEEGPLDDKPITGREFVEGKRTCDLYPIQDKLPPRFNNSEWFKGYGCEKPGHPFYLTTSMDYGRLPPTAHTMTQAYYPMECKFTDHLAKTGIYRNRSLNTSSNPLC